MKIYNFSAGPACLPAPVIRSVNKAITEYKSTGMSVIEMSHRSEPIEQLFDEVTDRIKHLLHIPENYEVLWLQGGASMQFSMVPLNLLPDGASADYIETGSWSAKAIHECNKVGFANVIGSSREHNFSYIPDNFTQKNNSKYIKGIANLGYRPTFNQKKILLEVHLFNFSGNLYDKYLSVEFIKFIRKEKKFKNLNQLKAQIKIDLRIAKKTK